MRLSRTGSLTQITQTVGADLGEQPLLVRVQASANGMLGLLHG